MERAQTTPIPEKLGLAQVYLAVDNDKKAESLLSSLVRELEDSEYGAYLMKAWILKAVAQWKQGLQKPAARTLIRALSQAEPERISRAFLDQGSRMKDLLIFTAETLQGEPASAREAPRLSYINHILSLFEDSVPEKVDKIKNKSKNEGADKGVTEIISPLIEPLSDREREVMILLSQGYSAGDVAEELIISVNTAKAHIKRIYQKLDVHNRKEAIERAISLQLLV